ncbi:hypothetical protein Nepgr_022543 [Nepenthes gracilis]|uniref:RRM domain-containing protein n=1 Tax=Nepenthes gracilis TaxID=150966 RepID=A0AAD3T286_NEPGR|nr:hypothetical protein Nepgr_022543 [Nepenthes gracilis]
MLGVGGFPVLDSAPFILRRRPSSDAAFFCHLCLPQTSETRFSVFPESFRNGFLSLARSEFRVCEQKKQSRGRNGALASEDFFEEEEFDFVGNDDGEEEDDNEDDVVIPFAKMNAWLQKKPRGFGEGKVYDTSIEDKLLEEIEQSGKSQLANVNKLKMDNPIKNNPKTEHKKDLKAPEEVHTGIRVRIGHLPKKKNIHRDLKSAFRGVPGIIGILPSVSGNKKTKDPICTGLAYVNFESMEVANRFIQMFSGKNVTFGKIEKQIKCELVNSSNSRDQECPAEIRRDASQVTATLLEGEEQNNVGTAENDPSLNLQVENEYEFEDLDNEFRDLDDEFEELNDEDIGENLDSSPVTEKDSDDGPKSERKSDFVLLSLTNGEKKRSVKKKSAVNWKTSEVPAKAITGAAKRLKGREKAVLADVFSRYRAKSVTLPSKER